MRTPPSLCVIVTIHDQDLLLAYEAEGKFSKTKSSIIYLFVGLGDTDKITDLPNVVIARNLANNIENYKYLVDFTAWYAIARNQIETCDYVSLLQYDVSISEDFTEKSLTALDSNRDAIVGYVPLEMGDRNFIRDNMGFKPLEIACKNIYGIEISPLLKSHIKLAHDKKWPTTNNVAMHRHTLEDFVRWFTPLAMSMGNEKSAGHAFERAIKLYSILSGRSNVYLGDVLSHFQMNSHETQDFKKDKSVFHRLLAKN